MAQNQIERHKLGRLGEKVALKFIGKGKLTNHKAPFDIVDFSNNLAYEVKTMAAASKDFKIHIGDESKARKREFAEFYGLTMILLVVVVFSKTEVEVYTGELTQSARISQLQQISK